MARVALHEVHVDYQLLSVRHYNLKRRVVDALQRRPEAPPVITALDDVSLVLEEGARVGLVGANGAGKSTLLSVMAGLLPPTRGEVAVEGKVLALVGSAAAGLDQEATGRDNVVSVGVRLGESPAAMRRRVDGIVEFSGLGDRIDHPVYTYSTGMQTRLRFSVLTSLRPDVLLVDEGIGTADAEFTERAHERLNQFISAAGILVLASHGDALLERQCDEAVWLHGGGIRTRGPVSDVLREYHASYAGA